MADEKPTAQDKNPALSGAKYEIVDLAVDRQENIVPGLAKPMATGIRNPIVVVVPKPDEVKK